MAVVRFRYEPQPLQWFTDNASKVLKEGEPAYCNESPYYLRFKVGDNTTELQNLNWNEVGAAVWGSITGDIYDQTDLINILNAVFDQYGSITSSATPTPNPTSQKFLFRVTALATNAVFANPTGLAGEFSRLFISVVDDGNARNLSFGPKYKFDSGITSPTITIPGQVMFMEFLYNPTGDRWDCIRRTNATSGGGTTNYRPIFASQNLSSSGTGSTGHIILCPGLLVPGGTMGPNGLLEIRGYVEHIGGNGGVTFNVFACPSYNSLVGAKYIGTTGGYVNVGLKTSGLWFDLANKNDEALNETPSISNWSNNFASSAPMQVVNVDTAQDMYIIITCQLDSALDTGVLNNLQIYINK